MQDIDAETSHSTSSPSRETEPSAGTRSSSQIAVSQSQQGSMAEGPSMRETTLEEPSGMSTKRTGSASAQAEKRKALEVKNKQKDMPGAVVALGTRTTNDGHVTGNANDSSTSKNRKELQSEKELNGAIDLALSGSDSDELSGSETGDQGRRQKEKVPLIQEEDTLVAEIGMDLEDAIIAKASAAERDQVRDLGRDPEKDRSNSDLDEQLNIPFLRSLAQALISTHREKFGGGPLTRSSKRRKTATPDPEVAETAKEKHKAKEGLRLRTKPSDVSASSAPTTTNVCTCCALPIGTADRFWQVPGKGKTHLVHEVCLLWTPDIPIRDTVTQFLVMEYADVIQESAKRSRRIKCNRCDTKGAGIGCAHTNCRRSFHFSCIQPEDGELLFSPDCVCVNEEISVLRLFFCDKHRVLPVKETDKGPVNILANWKRYSSAIQKRLATYFYIIEKVKQVNKTSGRNIVEIKWLGWEDSESTWEDYECFQSKKTLERYLKRSIGK